MVNFGLQQAVQILPYLTRLECLDRKRVYDLARASMVLLAAEVYQGRLSLNSQVTWEITRTSTAGRYTGDKRRCMSGPTGSSALAGSATDLLRRSSGATDCCRRSSTLAWSWPSLKEILFLPGRCPRVWERCWNCGSSGSSSELDGEVRQGVPGGELPEISSWEEANTPSICRLLSSQICYRMVRRNKAHNT